VFVVLDHARVRKFAPVAYLHLDASEMVRTAVPEDESPHMELDGSGLASVLAWMKGAAEDELAEVTADLRQVVPGVKRIRTLRERVMHRHMEKIDIDGQPVWRPVDESQIGPQGRTAGEPLKPEASMWRKVLLLFCRAKPLPEIVVLARDLDGYPDRRAGIEQVRNGLPWPFTIVAATPDPEIEGWLVSGFLPRDNGERTGLEGLRRELSFDPTTQSHRLTAHPNDAPTDAKRVLSRLCEDDRDREHACLQRDVLHQRGDFNGARAFLDEVDQRMVPIFGSRA
jgi:hypothetical protein